MIRHIVIFKYRPAATDGQVRQVTEDFRALAGTVPGVLSFEHGVDDSPEGKGLGFTHVHVLTFADRQARDAYLPHPDHRRFVENLERLQIVEDVFVVDYEPRI